MSHTVDTPADARQADNALAFRHLLHEVASHVTGLGLTLEMLGEPGTTPEDAAAMAGTARGALDDLRHLVADIGELTRFLHRHGDLHPARVEVTDLLADLERDGVTLQAGPVPDWAVRGERGVLGFILHLLARACRRLPGVVVTASAEAVGERFVRVDVWAVYEERPGVRRSLEKAPMVVDHFCHAVARDLGAQFVREQSKTGQRVGFVLPVYGR